jgi:hypothetical protein
MAHSFCIIQPHGVMDRVAPKEAMPPWFIQSPKAMRCKEAADSAQKSGLSLSCYGNAQLLRKICGL